MVGALYYLDILNQNGIVNGMCFFYWVKVKNCFLSNTNNGLEGNNSVDVFDCSKISVQLGCGVEQCPTSKLF